MKYYDLLHIIDDDENHLIAKAPCYEANVDDLVQVADTVRAVVAVARGVPEDAFSVLSDIDGVYDIERSWSLNRRSEGGAQNA